MCGCVCVGGGGARGAFGGARCVRGGAREGGWASATGTSVSAPPAPRPPALSPQQHGRQQRLPSLHEPLERGSIPAWERALGSVSPPPPLPPSAREQASRKARRKGREAAGPHTVAGRTWGPNLGPVPFAAGAAPSPPPAERRDPTGPINPPPPPPRRPRRPAPPAARPRSPAGGARRQTPRWGRRGRRGGTTPLAGGRGVGAPAHAQAGGVCGRAVGRRGGSVCASENRTPPLHCAQQMRHTPHLGQGSCRRVVRCMHNPPPPLHAQPTAKAHDPTVSQVTSPGPGQLQPGRT